MIKNDTRKKPIDESYAQPESLNEGDTLTKM